MYLCWCVYRHFSWFTILSPIEICLWETKSLIKIFLVIRENIFQNLFGGTQVWSHVSTCWISPPPPKRDLVIKRMYLSHFLCVRNSEKVWLGKTWDLSCIAVIWCLRSEEWMAWAATCWPVISLFLLNIASTFSMRSILLLYRFDLFIWQGVI